MSMLFTLTSASAQIALEEQKPLDNISIGIVGGATTPLDFNSVFPFNGVVGLKLQKDFTPVFGINVEGLTTFGDNHFNSSKTVVKGINTGVNGLINLSNLLCGYKGYPRAFEVSTETGLGWLHTWNDHSNYLTSKTGLNLAFNLSEIHSIIVNPTIYWNLSKSNKIQFNKNNAQLALLVGYVYHFKTSNGTHSFKTYDITSMNNEINDLRNELSKQPSTITKEITKTETVLKPIGNVVVCFAQDSYELTATAMTQLLEIPANSSVSIIGEASPEGTAEYNQTLSENRAKAVAEYLEKNNVNIISCQGIGTTNNASNRIVTVVIK